MMQLLQIDGQTILKNSIKTLYRQEPRAMTVVEDSGLLGVRDDWNDRMIVQPRPYDEWEDDLGVAYADYAAALAGLTAAVTEASAPSSSTAPSLITRAGRVYLEIDGRWMAGSDDNYGESVTNHSEAAGTGATPIMEWEHNGTVLEAGTVIHSLSITGRCAGGTILTEVEDMEIYAALKTPNPLTRWETGYDNDGEDTETLLYNDRLWTPNGSATPWTGPVADKHHKTIDIDHTVADTSEIHLYFRPIPLGILARRYFYTTWSWKISVPV